MNCIQTVVFPFDVISPGVFRVTVLSLARRILGLALLALFLPAARAEYSHFTDVQSGSDIVTKEVRWPYWNGGYYNPWFEDSFTSSDGVSGYFYNGLPEPSSGSPVTQTVNWSFWPLSSPLNITDVITPAYTGPETFGRPSTAEGTMLEVRSTYPFWQTNVWYRVVYRVWPAPNGTPHLAYAGSWVRDPVAGAWHCLGVMQLPFAGTGITGSDTFQENASGNQHTQETDYRRSYYHYNGVWKSSTNWDISVPSNNSTENAGLLTNSVDGTNNAVYYICCQTNNLDGFTGTYSHGMTSPTFNLVQPATPPLDPIIVTNYTAVTYGNQLVVQWLVPSNSSPQYAYQVNVYTNAAYSGNVVASAFNVAPETQVVSFNLPAGATPYPQLTIIDVMNQTNAPINLTVSNAILSTATTVAGASNGLAYAYYQSAANNVVAPATNWTALPNFASLTPVANGVVNSLDLTPRLRRQGYAFNFTGYLNAPSNGLYAFSLTACDGSKLYIDGQLIVNWDGDHSASDLGGWIGLQAGLHTLNLQYYCDVQPAVYSGYYDYYDMVSLTWSGPGFAQTAVPPSAFYYVPAGGQPVVALASPAAGATIAGGSVPFGATVTAGGTTVSNVQYYVDGYYWGKSAASPYNLNSFVWASPTNTVAARLVYNKTNTVDSPVISVSTTNLTLAPWQNNQVFFHYDPSGASITNGTYSLVGDGVNLLTRQVVSNGTIIAHLTGMNAAVNPADGSSANPGWQAGIIMRGSTNLTPGYPWGKTGTAPFTALFTQVGGGAYYQDETMVNGGGGYASGSVGSYSWFMIQRTNTTCVSSVSANGTSWTPVWTNTLSDLGGTAFVGLFTCANPSVNPNIPAATFNNVSITGNVLGPPTVSVTPLVDTAYAGQAVTFTALPGGNAPFYYQWQLNGVNLAGATNATLALTNLQPANSGSYNVVLTNANGLAAAGGTLTVLTLPSAPGAILSNNPVGYWRLNETAGPTAYDTMGSYNGTGQGATVFGVPGVTNAPFTGFGPGNFGAQFGGDSAPSDIAIPPFNVTTTNFTITGWVNCNGTQDSWSGLVFSRNAAAQGLMVVNNGGNELRYSWNDNGNDYNASTGLKLPSGQWAFVALTITPTQAIVYFATNATLQSWTNTTANAGQTLNGSFYLGCDPTSLLSGSRQFNGSLDEIAIYNQTLPRAQISQIFSASQTPLPAVTLTAPGNGAIFGAGTNLNLTAGVTTNGHAITAVQFYNGASLLGVSSNAPYSLTWSNLAVGTYTALAQVTFDGTNLQSAAPAIITVNPFPAVPPNLSVVAVASNQISLSWSAATNATAYVVSRNGAAVATVSGTGWLDSGLAANTTYSYSVTATAPWGNSAPSVTNSATTLASGNGLAWDAAGTGGAADGSGNWAGGTADWWSGTAVTSWMDGNIAVFGAGTPGSYTVTINNNVTPAGLVFAGVAGAYTLAGGGGGVILSGVPAFNCAVDGTVSAVIQGTGGLLKTGAGTLNLGGVNTYAGGTTISNGTLQILTGGSLPGNITNNATLALNSSSSITFSNLVSGTGSLIQAGGSTLFLTNANVYKGGTTISNGTVSLGTGASSSENVNALGTGTVAVMAGGTLQLDNAGGTTTFNVTNAITLNGGTVYSIDNYEHLTGPVNVAAGGGILSQYYNTKSLWLDGQLTGSGPLTVNNNGSGSYPPYSGVHFSNPANSYSGTITVSGNAVTVDNTYALSNAVVNVTGAGSSGPLIWGSGVTGIILGGLSGTYNIANGGNALAVGNNNSSTAYSGILSGTGSLAKLGTGTFTLSGANSYTGATTVSNGLLLVNGSLAGGATVAANGLLGGVGVISGATTVASGGTLTPGNASLGTLTVGNSLTLNAGAKVLLGVSKNGGTLTNGLLTVTGTLAYGGTLTVTNIGTNAFALGDSFQGFSATGHSGGFSSVTLPALPANLGWNTNSLISSGVLTVVALPAITNQPVAVAVNAGATAGFSVGATGSGTLAYQWQMNGANLIGATLSTLSLTNVQLTNAGNYTVVVTNSYGSVTSSIASLTVYVVPTISSSPTNLTVYVNSNATFSVTAGGTPVPANQWLFNGTNLVGATLTNYVVTGVQTNNEGSYSVILTNLAGSVTSSVASLSLYREYGCAPLPYPSLLASNGARHLAVPGYQLGTTNPLSTDARTNGAGQGGLTFSSLTVGGAGTVQVVATGSGYVNGWIDFNTNGSWANTGDQVFTNVAVVAGTNVLALNVPGSALVTTGAWARVRFSHMTNLTYTGQAPDGEVEDLTVAIGSGAPPLVGGGSMGTGGFSVNVTGNAGQTYVLLTATNLTAPVWVPVVTNVASTNGVFQLTDPAATNASEGFYKISAP